MALDMRFEPMVQERLTNIVCANLIFLYFLKEDLNIELLHLMCKTFGNPTVLLDDVKSELSALALKKIIKFDEVKGEIEILDKDELIKKLKSYIVKMKRIIRLRKKD